MKIEIKRLHCYRCGFDWTPTKSDIRQCARCKSAYFDTPKPKSKQKQSKKK